MEVTQKHIATLSKLYKGIKTIRYGDLDTFYQQTVAEHVDNMLFLSPEMLKKGKCNLDAFRVNGLIMVHDIPEMGMEKDFTLWAQDKDPSLVDLKNKMESDKINSLAKIHGSWIKDLFYEFELQVDDSSKYVNWLDRLESSVHLEKKFEVTGPARHKSGEMNGMIFSTSKLVKATLPYMQMKDVTLERLHNVRHLHVLPGEGKEWETQVKMLEIAR
jgi:hypothetical protein